MNTNFYSNLSVIDSTVTYSLNLFSEKLAINYSVNAQTIMRQIKKLSEIEDLVKLINLVVERKNKNVFIYVTPQSQDFIINILIPQIKKGMTINMIASQFILNKKV